MPKQNKEIKGILKALDTLYWKKHHFGGAESWDYICSELSNLLPAGLFFQWDEKQERTVIIITNA